MKEVRWGIIGCGDVTEVKSGPALQKIEDSQLVAVMRRDVAKARDYAQRHGVARWYGSAEELLADPQVNAVYVATPPSSHEMYAIQAMETGKPVYVEKPMSISSASCDRMLAVSEKTGMPMFVAYYRRCLPSFLKIRDLLSAGVIGEIRFVRIAFTRNIPAEHFEAMPQTQSQLQTCDVDAATVEIAANVGNGLISQQPGQQQPVLRSDLSWRVRPEIAGGGYFVDYAPHQLDILDFLLGPIEEVQSLVVNQAGLYPAEDIVCAQFCFASGVLGSGVWCFTVGEGCTEDYMEIVGSKGYIRCEAFGNMGVRWQTVGGSGEFVQPRPRHIQQDMLQKVVDELLGRGKCPSDGHSAIRTNRVLDQILCSYYKDREKLP